MRGAIADLFFNPALVFLISVLVCCALHYFCKIRPAEKKRKIDFEIKERQKRREL